MPAAYSQIPERRPNLALSFEELLTAIVRLRSGRQSVSDEESFRAHVRTAWHSAMQEGAARGYAPGDVSMAGYAVVALLDESVLNLRSPIFTSWPGHPFQQEVWREDLAGEAFFDYLQQLMGRRDSAELADLLEVFHLCLLLGYRGRYGLTGGGDLAAIIRSVQNKISRSRAMSALLSPQAQLPRDLPQPRPPDKWSKRLRWAAVCAAAISLVVFAICKVVLISGASEIRSLAGH
ncbi:MAG TPA: DotU family type IV/VI secretion system protein [Candidatus Angelobacter sp.]|nr:DotU family type IV/VI secretion system protein [Candidatus Angelobacter sp.]